MRDLYEFILAATPSAPNAGHSCGSPPDLARAFAYAAADAWQTLTGYGPDAGTFPTQIRATTSADALESLHVTDDAGTCSYRVTVQADDDDPDVLHVTMRADGGSAADGVLSRLVLASAAIAGARGLEPRSVDAPVDADVPDWARDSLQAIAYRARMEDDESAAREHARIVAWFLSLDDDWDRYAESMTDAIERDYRSACPADPEPDFRWQLPAAPERESDVEPGLFVALVDVARRYVREIGGNDPIGCMLLGLRENLVDDDGGRDGRSRERTMLDDIFGILDGEGYWSPDTLDYIAEVFTSNGWTISEVEA